MRRLKAWGAAGALAAGFVVAGSADGSVHLWQITELYRNADGSVEFVEMISNGPFENFLATLDGKLNSSNGNLFDFPADVAGNTQSRRVIVASAGFANEAGGITPDFTLTSPLVIGAGGTITFTASGFGTVDSQVYGAMPSYRNSYDVITNTPVVALNMPTNFAGVSGSITSAVSLSSSAAHTNYATGGSVVVTGSAGSYVSEIDPLTSAERTGSAGINNSSGDGLASGDVLVMLWLSGTDPDKTNLRSTLDAAGGAVYDVLAPSDPAFLSLQGSYSGFDTLIRFTDPAFNFTPAFFNWNFSAHPNVDVDQIAVVPEPVSLLALAAGVGMAVRRRREER